MGTENTPTGGSPVERVVSRRALAAGNEYRFFGYPKNGFRIKWVALPGHPENDGALPGVCFQWQRRLDRSSWFYPCKTESEFWSDIRFANACDPEANA